MKAVKRLIRHFAGLLFWAALMGPCEASVAAESPVLPNDWIIRIQSMALNLSKRPGTPMESFGVTFNKDGTILREQDYLLAVIPTDATKYSNLGESHKVCVATFDERGILKLDGTAGNESGPDGYDPLPLKDFPKACEQLIIIRHLQRALAARGLHYEIEAAVVEGRDEKSWHWEICFDNGGDTNKLYAMEYFPDSGELHSTKINPARLARKVQAAAGKAGMRLIVFKDAREL